MINNNYLRIEDLVNNPTPRVPICLCIDISDSMNATIAGGELTGETIYRDGKEWNVVRGGQTRMDELNDGIRLFYNAIRDDEMAIDSAEICIVAFNDNARCILDFANIERQDEIPDIKAFGETNLGDGVNLALDLLEKRKEEYQDKGIDYFQPWLVLMTDGEPNGDKKELERAIDRTRNLISHRKLAIFPIGIGEDSDMDTLNLFTIDHSALRLRDLRFEEFFLWLSRSVSEVSKSMPGEDIILDTEGMKGWSDLEFQL